MHIALWRCDGSAVVSVHPNGVKYAVLVTVSVPLISVFFPFICGSCCNKYLL